MPSTRTAKSAAPIVALLLAAGYGKRSVPFEKNIAFSSHQMYIH
jgi:hypothetical protein